MAYDGVTVVEVVAGREGLWGIRNRNLIPLGGLIELRNATLEDYTWRTGGGASKLGISFGAGISGKVAFNFWPDAATERNIVVGSDGKIWKDDGVAGAWSAIHTGLSTSGWHPFLVPGAAEASGSNRKLFYADGVNDPRYLDGDGVAMTALASPAADWTPGNVNRQPSFFVPHQGYVWAGGNKNAPNRIYRSSLIDNTSFGASPYSLPVFPGLRQRLVGGLSYKGVLLLWAYPSGLYAVDTSDPSDANWRIIQVGSPGAAGPMNMAAIEDDIMWVSPDGSWHLVSATTATGSVRAEDLTARKLGSYSREQINLSQMVDAQMLYYSNKQEIMLACSAQGQTAKTRRLHMDLNKRSEVGERWLWWDRDANECIFLRKIDETMTPVFCDTEGQLWLLDRAARVKDGAGYQFSWFLKPSDFSEVIPGWQGRKKNLRFLQLEYDARSAATHTIEIYADGDLIKTMTFTLMGSGATLPAILPFVLGTETLLVTARRRLTGQGVRIAVRGYSSGANEDVSISRVLIGLELGE